MAKFQITNAKLRNLDLKDLLKKEIDKVLISLKIGKQAAYSVTFADNLKFGDLTSNVALVCYKSLSSDIKIGTLKTAGKLAEEIVSLLKGSKEIEAIFSEITIEGTGFINFFLREQLFITYLNQLLESGSLDVFLKREKDRNIEMYENTQPNTNKPLHIGHLRNTALGVSIVNIKKALGANAWSVNINNDRGIHIVKAMWGFLEYARNFEIRNSKFEIEKDLKLAEPKEDWRKLLGQWVGNPEGWESPDRSNMKPDHFVGKFYVLGDKAEKECAEKVSEQMRGMLLAWERGEENLRWLWQTMNGWFYEGFRQTHARFLEIGVDVPQFDKEWYESQFYDKGKKIILDNLGKGIFYKREDGAVVARLAKYKLPDKIVLRPDGTTVYMTQDLELARKRLEEDKAELVAYIVGNEQDLHFRQLFAICEELGFGRRSNLLHISYGMVNLASGLKMSSREGTAVSADELMDQVVSEIKNKFKIGNDSLAEKIGIGAIKYWMLKYNPKAEIEFDIEKSVSLAGNSGPYLQYAYARTQSVLTKFKIQNSKFKTKGINYKLNNEELVILRLFVRFSDAVHSAADNFAPNLLCNYLFTLAQSFNLFYEKHTILGDEKSRDFRLALTEATGIILKKGLNLLGISAPEKM